MNVDKDFKEIYQSFVSNNKELVESKEIKKFLLPGAGWGTAKSIKRAGNDEAVVNKLFAGGESGTITAKELRWFTPAQLTALKNKVIVEAKGDSDKLKPFEKLFGQALVISHKKHHSETKQRVLFNAYEAIKNAAQPFEKFTPSETRERWLGKKEEVKSEEPKRSKAPNRPLPPAPRTVTDKTTQQGDSTSFKARQQMLLNAGVGGQKAPDVQPKKTAAKAEEPKPRVISTSPPKTHSVPDVVEGAPPPPPPKAPDAVMLSAAARRAGNATKEDTSTAVSSNKAKPKAMKESDKAGQVGSMAEEALKKAQERAERLAARNAKKEGK